MSIFRKLIITFLVIIIVPLAISFYISENTASDLMVRQISSETMNSIELVSNSIDTLLKKMSSIALYVNDDESIKDLIVRDAGNPETVSTMTVEEENLGRLERINKFSAIISNMAFNMMGTRCYIAILTMSGRKYTSWAYEGESSDSYLNEYIQGNAIQKGTGLIRIGIEKNYIKSDANLHPYVMTLAKNILDTTGRKQFGTIIISVPENETSKLLAAGDQLKKRVILDENMTVISSTVKQWLDKPFKSIYDCSFSAGQKGFFIFEGPGMEKTVLSYITVRDWKVVDIKSYESITRQLVNTRNRLLAINVLFIIIFLGISAFIAKSISKPLNRLARLMLATDLEIPNAKTSGSRRDEIGILENSFDVMRSNIKKLMQDNLEKERKKRDAELKSLQAQISPHFLFNTLNAVRWAAINKNTKKAANMVLALSNLLRMTIVKGSEFITVEEETENLRSYVAIFQMRHSAEFELVCNIETEVRSYRIPKLLLQPLVENAIIHGFEVMSSKGVIEVDGFRRDGHVILRVRDNGIGIDMDFVPGENSKEFRFSGIGIRNVDERIKLNFGEDYGLHIESVPGIGTAIEIKLPEHYVTKGD